MRQVINDFLKQYWAEIVIGVLLLIIQLLTGFASRSFRWLWNKLRPKPKPLPQGTAFPFQYATSFSDLQSRIRELIPNLHGDLNITHQQRLIPTQQQVLERRMDNSQLLILVGRTGIGKTREAIEALRRREVQLGEPITILFPKPPFTPFFALPPGAPTQHLVLFIDNIHDPPYYTAERAGAGAATAGDFPTWFRECLKYFKGYTDFRVIATARNDLPGRDYQESMRPLRPVFNEFHFEELPLPSWSQDTLDGLIDAMAAWRGITIPDDARKELARRCAAEGTPNYAHLAVSRANKGGTLTFKEVQDLPLTFNDLWRQTWNERIAPYAARVRLFHAIALLRAAGLAPLIPVTLELAARLWGRPWWWRKRKVMAALSPLRAWIEPKADTLECPDAYLPQDVSLAWPGHTAVLARTLLHFLPRDPSRLAPELGNFANFLQDFPLGNRAQNLEEAIACYKRALEVYTREDFPVDWATTQNNLGAAYADRIREDRAQNLEEAIACYKRALEVYTREDFPREHNLVVRNRQVAREKLKDLQQSRG